MATPDPTADAARYIDRVVAINKQHGGSRPVSPAEYQRAVKQAAAMSARVRPAAAAEDREPSGRPPRGR
jgi:hypothetical protein